MLSSRRISSRKASTPASAYVITRPCSDIRSPQLKHMLIHGFRRRFGTLLGKFDGLVDKLFYLLIGRLQLTLLDPRVEKSFAGEFHRILLFPLLNFFTSPIIGAGITFMVSDIAISLTFDQGRAAVVASALNRRLRDLMDCNNILPVH